MPLQRSSLKVFKCLPWRTDFPLLDQGQLEQLARQFQIMNLIKAIQKYELVAMDTELKTKQCTIKFTELFDPETDYPAEMRIRSYKLSAAFINPLCYVLTAYRVGDAVVRWCGQMPSTASGVQLRAKVPRHLTYPANSKHWNHMKDLSSLVKNALRHLDAYINHCNTPVTPAPVVNPVTATSHLTLVGAHLMKSRQRIRSHLSFLTFVSNYEAVALGLNLAFQGFFDLDSRAVVDAMRSHFDGPDSVALEAIAEEIGRIKGPFLGALWIDPLWALSANAMESFCPEEIMVASKCLGSYRPERLEELNRRLFRVFTDAARGRLSGVAIAKALRDELTSATNDAAKYNTFYRRYVDEDVSPESSNERLNKDHPTLYEPNPPPVQHTQGIPPRDEEEEEEEEEQQQQRPSVDAPASQTISEDVDVDMEIGRTIGASDQLEDGELIDEGEGRKNAEKRALEDGELTDQGESTAQVKRRKISGNRKGDDQGQVKDVDKEHRSERRKDDDEDQPTEDENEGERRGDSDKRKDDVQGQRNDSDAEESEEEATGNEQSTGKRKAVLRIPPRRQESDPQQGKGRPKTQPPKQKAKPKAKNSKRKRKTRQQAENEEDEEDEEEELAQLETNFSWREIEDQSLTRSMANVFAVDTLNNPEGLLELAPPEKRVNHIATKRSFFNPDGSSEECIIKFHTQQQLQFFHQVAERISVTITETFGPLHMVDPPQSMMHVLTESQYQQYTIQQVHDVLSRGKVIVVHGCQGWGMEFGLEQLSKLGPLDGPLYVTDQSEPFGESYDEQGRLTTLRQFHDIVTGPDERRRALNALSLPIFSPVVSEPALTQDQAIWNLSNVLPVVRASVFPIDMKYWNIAGGGGASSPWHNDAHGYATYINGESGLKLFAFACDTDNPEPSTSFMNIQSQYKAEADLRVEGILVRAGVRLIMPPGMPHAAFTIHPAVCSGGHFYTWATMEHTVHALMRSLIFESIFTNTEEHAFDARQMLVRMMVFLYEEMILQGRTHSENPLLPSLEEEKDWLALSAFFCVIKMLNILALDTYRPRGLGRALEAKEDLEKAHRDHDVNAMLTDERIGMIYARGIMEDAIDIFTHRYRFDFRHDLYEPMLVHYLVYLKRTFNRTYRQGKDSIPSEGCLFDNPVAQEIFDAQVEWVARSRDQLGKGYDGLMAKNTSVPDMRFTDWEAPKPFQYTSYLAQRRKKNEYMELGMHEGDVRCLNMWNRQYRAGQPDS